MATLQYLLDQTHVPIYGSDSGTKWLTPQVASYRRVLSQDSAKICGWAKKYGVPGDMLSTMLTQLERHCGVPAGSSSLFPQEGAQLVQRYTSISYDEQVRWLLEDLGVREVIYAFDGARAACNTSIGSALSDQAVSLRMSINSSQISHLKQMISAQPPAKVAEIRLEIQAGSRTVHTSTSGPQRIPLAESTPNIVPLPHTPLKDNSKRKRVDVVPTSHPMVIPIGQESDDEDALQHKSDALEARIAAIRARTIRDDDLVPHKKAKTARDAMTLKETFAAVMSPTPSTSRATKQGSKTTQPAVLVPSTQKSHQYLDDNMKTKPGMPVKATNVKLVLQRQGQAGYRLKTPSSTNFSRIATIAKKHFSIASPQILCLHFEGQRLSAAETVKEAGLKDFAILEVIDLPSKSPTIIAQVRVADQKLDAESIHLASVNASPDKPVPVQPVVDLTSSSPPQAIAQAAKSTLIVPPPPVQVEPELCQEQQEVVDLIVAGHNVFYTGSAGCGKSTVLKAFTARLRDNGKTVRIVAPTGKAALDINGSTTWTYAGWTPGHMKKPLEELIKAAHGKFVSKRFNSTDVLVIDEISMVESHLLERLSRIMQAARGNYKPFGGVQMVVTGDFCQLPPVKAFQFCMCCGREQKRLLGANRETLYRCPQHGDCNDDDKWAFRGEVWEKCEFKHINLTNIHRQSDQVFIGILQKLRIGKPLTNADRQLLLDHPCDVKNAVKLFPTREEVRRINQTEFDKLVTAKREYRCLDLVRWNEVHGNLRDKGRRSPVDNSLEALREHRLETKVEFKANMLVVLLVNLDIANGLVNGSQGRVIGFEPYAESKLPRAAVFEGGGFSSSSRGGGSKKPQRGREASPEPSQTSVQGELHGEYAALREGQIKDFIEQPCNSEKRWPIVLFDNGIRRTIYADCQVNELGDEKPYTLLARTQIPLLAAWAMTIHKSQGMTLNRVIVDLGRSFEEGQEYVALSRARSLDGLKVISLGSNVGTGGNEQVKKFLKDKFNVG